MSPFSAGWLNGRAINGTVSNTAIAQQDPLQVICAWPVSGQYGPGSRFLYYVLVAICVLARKSDWLRNACLAATLLLPMVAAVHGIVLAAVNVDHAVDLDIYGAFQLCAIGVLVAPVTAKLSRTYFRGPGHNAIILWSLFVVAGLISLMVEFIRVAGATYDCPQDGDGNPLNKHSKFPYGNVTCGPPCSPDSGPTSLIRKSPGDNIYVVPAPTVLTFNAGILLSAACCIPAILLIAALLLRSFKSNWNTRFVHELALKLRAFVFVFEDGTEKLTIEDIRGYVGSLSKLGIVRFVIDERDPYAATRDDKLTTDVAAEEQVEGDGQVSDNASGDDGFTKMFQYLGSHSTLVKHEYEIWGSTLQVLEFKLAKNSDDENLATELRKALQDLDQEGVDAVVVEGLPSDIGDKVNWFMQQLRNDQQIRKDNSKTSKSNDNSRAGNLIEKYTMVTIFSALVIAILAVGEKNLWSDQVKWQIEPTQNIGQWAPIAGTILLMVGSVYVVVAEGMRKERRQQRKPFMNEEDSDGPIERQTRRCLQLLITLSDMLSPQRKRFDDSDFGQNAQRRYPRVPGEEHRRADLDVVETKYLQRRSSVSSFRSNISMSPSFGNSRVVSNRRSDTEFTVDTVTRRSTLEVPPQHSPHHATQSGRDGGRGRSQSETIAMPTTRPRTFGANSSGSRAIPPQSTQPNKPENVAVSQEETTFLPANSVARLVHGSPEVGAPSPHHPVQNGETPEQASDAPPQHDQITLIVTEHDDRET